jgi:hypothetical protein
MAVFRKSIQSKSHTLGRDGGVGPENISDTLRKARYCFDNFMQEPLCTKSGALAAPGGTALDPCLIFTGRHTFGFATTQDETDQFYPTLATDGGYNFVTPATPVLADGVEVNFGGDKLAHPRNCIPSSENFFYRVLINAVDASGADITFGVKKVATTVATLTELTDVAALRILGDSSSTAGAFSIITVLNNAGSTDYTSTALTTTGLEDTTSVELEVYTYGGKAYFKVNGVPVGTSVSYTFDTGDTVAPILRAVQTTDTCAKIVVLAFECGLLEDRTDATLVQMAQATV